MNHPAKDGLRYRPDIDGLRGIAVALVVAFHFAPIQIGGGFLGVDIFFVISGYLITQILAADITGGRFSLLGFYDRRIRRIVPALFTMLAITTVVVFFLLAPGALLSFAKSALHASVFTSNIYFWLNTGYFDQSAVEQPLLHVWSLSVEEQFYLLWPLALFALWRHRLWLIAILFFASLALDVVLLQTASKAAFYLAPSRAWEFLLGAMVALWPIPVRVPLSGAIGVGLIAAGVAIADPWTPPVIPAGLLPCLGAALLLADRNTSASRALSSRPLVWLGLISYSLYLWHWPVIVFYRHWATVVDIPVAVIPVLAALSVGLAYASWRFVEQPARLRRNWRVSIPVGAIATCAVVGISTIIISHQGFPFRVPPEQAALASAEVMWQWPCPQDTPVDQRRESVYCVLGAPWQTASVKGMLWGDSHAGHYAPLVHAVAAEKNAAFVLMSGCPPILDNRTTFRRINDAAYNKQCGDARASILRRINEIPGLTDVLIAMAWSAYPRDLYTGSEKPGRRGLALLRSSLAALIEDLQGHRITLLGEVPPTGRNLVNCLRDEGSLLWRQPCEYRSLDAARVRSTVAPVLAILKSAGPRVVDPVEALCDASTCPTFVNGEFIYRDDRHLRRNLAPKTARILAKRIGVLRESE